MQASYSLLQETVIDTRGLVKRYGNVSALRSLDLQVPKHSIFGFLGPNGAGKSTAIKLLLGLIKPTSGEGKILGYDIVRDSLAIRQRVGYLPQEPRFYDYMTPRQTLRFAARFFYRGPRHGIEAHIAEALELVGLADKADRPIRGFSGGERQRLGIAQAQINQPDLLILDEPAAALDPVGRRDVLAIMERLRERTTIFYSTHILDDVQRVSDRVAILDRGQVITQASIEQLLAASTAASFSLVLAGDVTAAYRRVTDLPWVAGIDVLAANGTTTWQVRVTDQEAAEWHLLPEVVAGGTTRVIEYGRKRQTLEDIFMNLIAGGNHERASIAATR